MCGILGWCNFKLSPNINLLKDISNKLIRRGPDFCGEHYNDYISFVHRRLSIIDLSENSNQPLVDTETGNVLIFNGEIYNFKDLKKEILHELVNLNCFKSNGDAEVILMGFKVFDFETLLNKLEGMFSFALWDNQKKKLYLARDKLGEKPLFYGSDSNNGIIFSSTVQSLISHQEISKKIKLDTFSLDQYLSLNYLLFEKTFFKNLKSLEPASYIIFDQNSDEISTKKYWKLENCFRNKEIKNLNFKNSKEKLSSLIETSIASRIYSDVDVGTFLSGGIDSSLISFNLQKICNNKLLTHNISFEQNDYDESKYAKYLSKKINAKINVYPMPKPKIIAQDFPEIIDAMDQPMADTSFISNFYLSKFSSKYSKVILSGDGADEILGGYETYIADIYKNFLNKFTFISPLIEKVLLKTIKYDSQKKISWNYKIKKFFENLNFNEKKSHILWRSIFNDSEKKLLLNSSFSSENYLDKIYQKYNLVSDLNYLDQNMFIDLITWFPNDILYKVDRTTMHHSQEGRLPFIDSKIIEFCCSLPITYKINFLNKKFILKKILENLVGKKYLNRKKRGFNSPVGLWMRQDSNFRELTYSLLLSSKMQNLFSRKVLINYFDDHRKEVNDNSFKLFTLIVLSQWLNNNKLSV